VKKLLNIDSIPEMIWIRRKLKEDYGPLWWRNSLALRVRDGYLPSVKELLTAGHASDTVFITAEPALVDNSDEVIVVLPEYHDHINALANADEEYAQSVILSAQDLDEIRRFYFRWAERKHAPMVSNLIDAFQILRPTDIKRSNGAVNVINSLQKN
jgi:hypothetical protein